MIITVVNQKGGTGKTSTALALAQAAAYNGKSVLAIDLDSQRNLTFLLDANENKKGIVDFLKDKPAEKCVQTVNDIDVMSGSPKLFNLDDPNNGVYIDSLKKAVNPFKDNVDLIVIDTPPTPGLCQYLGIAAADRVIIPVKSDILSLQGLAECIESVRKISPSAEIDYIYSQHSTRTIANRLMTQKIDEFAKESEIKFLGSVRNGTAIQESQIMHKSLFETAPKSNPAVDYMSIYERIMSNE